MPLPRIQRLIVQKLNELGHLNDKDTEEVFQSKEEVAGKTLEKLLQTNYGVTPFQILVAKAKSFRLNPFHGRRYRINEYTFAKLDPDFCLENKVVPVGCVGEFVIVALSNPFNLQVTRKIQEVTSCSVSTLLALEEEIEEILKDTRQSASAGSLAFGDVVDALHDEFSIEVSNLAEQDFEDEESGPIIQLANKLIEEAYFDGASDLHIEPFENECRIRFRIDGKCSDRLSLPPRVAVSLVTRIKVMANLDIAEKRIPQDGRIVFSQFTKKNMDIDLRVATAPLNHGEGVVMRILDKQRSTMPLPSIGYEPENLAKYKEVIKKPYGMILHCGPTGSGKSMTLYAALNEINSDDIVIRTAEDPIEYTQQGLCQMQVNPKIGLTFARALRSFLRQDPDVILVGEIRDMETAGIAIEAALTGHLLFSTLHTNDAASAITRLTEIGVEPFMVSASLLCVCAQRLMRRVCKSCRQAYHPEGRELDIFEKGIGWSGNIYRASTHGCPNCNRCGYKGRIGIHELMITTDKLIKAINEGRDASVIKRIAMMDGTETLHQDSLKKVRDGISSMAEAIATVPPDIEDIEALYQELEIEEAHKKREDEERREKVKALREEVKDETQQPQ